MIEVSVYYETKTDLIDLSIGKMTPSDVLKFIELINLYGFIEPGDGSKYSVKNVDNFGDLVTINLKPA
jgi:hypothetical protein